MELINTEVYGVWFFIMMLPAFLALVKPASHIAKPACIQNTSAAPMRYQNSTDM